MQNIWVFSFLHPLDDAEAAALATALRTQLATWAAHTVPVKSKVSLQHTHFLFIEAISDVSGCSIDWLHQTVLQIVQDLDLTLADASRIFYWQDDVIASIDFRELEPALHDGRLHPATLVFDPQAIQRGDFERWQARLIDTWMARYIPAEMLKAQ